MYFDPESLWLSILFNLITILRSPVKTEVKLVADCEKTTLITNFTFDVNHF